jgi:hypothetical protein
MDVKVFAVVISLMCFGSFAHAEVVNFECSFGEAGGDQTRLGNNHSVDMTNKTWEKISSGVTRIWEDAVVSSTSIAVKGQYTSDGYPTREIHMISRVDLSYSYKYELFSQILGGWQESGNWVGQCKIVEAPTKAF